MDVHLGVRNACVAMTSWRCGPDVTDNEPFHSAGRGAQTDTGQRDSPCQTPVPTGVKRTDTVATMSVSGESCSFYAGVARLQLAARTTCAEYTGRGAGADVDMRRTWCGGHAPCIVNHSQFARLGAVTCK